MTTGPEHDGELDELDAAKQAQTAEPLHPLLARRWSPRAFADKPVPPQRLVALFEAARWAPSSGNSQPVRFVVGLRGDATYERIFSVLSRGNKSWAGGAPVLFVATAARQRDDGSPLRHAAYDTGQALATLTVQATAVGLAVHQMGSFDVDAARRELGLPDHVDPWTVVAVGYRGDPGMLAEDLGARERRPRKRRSLRETVYGPGWGEPAAFLGTPSS